MPATVTSITPKRTVSRGPIPPPRRRPFRDSPKLILAGIAVLVGVLIALVAIANGTSRFSPDFLSEFVLYALSAADITMLAALLFARAQHHQAGRRARQAARSRFAPSWSRCCSATFVPSVLVLIVGGAVFRTSVDRWFNTPMDEILTSANKIASDYYHERQMLVSDHAARIARALAPVDLSGANLRRIRDLLAPDVTLQRVQMVEVYRVAPVATSDSLPNIEPVVDVARRLPPGYSRAAAVASRRRRSPASRTRAAAPARRRRSTRLGQIARQFRRSAACRRGHPRQDGARPASSSPPTADGRAGGSIAEYGKTFEQYPAARLGHTLAALPRNLGVTLMILVSATWMGLSWPGSRPVGCSPPRREIGAGRLSGPQSHDEFGSLVEAFNSMASELASNRKVEIDDRAQAQARRSRGRRRYIETILGASPASSRSTRPARSPRSTAPPRGCSRSTVKSSGNRRSRSSIAWTCSRSPGSLPTPPAPRSIRPCTRWPSRAKGRNCTSRSPRPRSSATAARPKGRCWCSTT
jgi:hypothetical protein